MQNKLTTYLPKLATFIAIMVGVVLGIKGLNQADVWWMLRTGDWMVQNQSFVYKDVFSYTFSGVEWISVKWLYEVIIYGLQSIGGPSFIYILQSIVNALIAIYFLKTAKVFHRLHQKEDAIYNGIASILGLFILYVLMEFRMIGRPEMTSHLMTLLFVYKYMQYRVMPSNSIYWLVLLQTLWANMHEAYGVGIVITATMLIGMLAEKVLSKWLRSDIKVPNKAIYAGLLSIAAVSINPRGPRMITHPFEIFSQVGENKFTTELWSYKTTYYWEQKEAYMIVGILAILLLGIIFMNPRKRFLQSTINTYGFGYLALIGLFFYLALTAHRNIPFFGLVALPLASYYIYSFGVSLVKKSSLFKKQQLGYALVAMVGIGFYTAVATNNYYKAVDSKNRYGLHIVEYGTPIKVVDFIKEQNLQGYCFSDFYVSSYQLWEQRPNFKAFIDFRDLDIYPAKFFKEFIYTCNKNPTLFPKIDEQYSFDYALLSMSMNNALHKYLFDSEDWIPVYADEVATLYVRNKEEYKQVIAEYGYKGNTDFFSSLSRAENSAISKAINNILWPFYQYELEEDPLANIKFFSLVGENQKAIELAIEAVNSSKTTDLKYEANQLLGLSYLKLYNEEQNKELITKAIAAFDAGLALDKSRTECITGKAQAEMAIGGFSNALITLKKAEKLNPTIDVYDLTANCYMALMQAPSNNAMVYVNKWFEYKEKAYQFEPSQFRADEIMQVACQVNNCDIVAKYYKTFSDKTQLPMILQDCARRCRVD